MVTNHPMQTLELLEGRNLFDPVDYANKQYVLPLALAQNIGNLGPPPLDMIKQSPLFETYFDIEGKSTILMPRAAPLLGTLVVR